MLISCRLVIIFVDDIYMSVLLDLDHQAAVIPLLYPFVVSTYLQLDSVSAHIT